MKVTLRGAGKRITTRTNNFGDFEFEGLQEDMDYSVKVELPSYEPQTFKVNTKIDVYLEEIYLIKRSLKGKSR